jgi:hypothetical protein
MKTNTTIAKKYISSLWGITCWALIFIFHTTLQAAEKIRHIVNVGLDSGVTVEIVGQDSDIIYIRRDGKLIGSQRIEDHPMTPGDVAYTRAEDSTAGINDWNVALRSGKDKDVFTCYAVRENGVFNNGGERFRFGQRGDGLSNYSFGWQNDTLNISFGRKRGRITWDPKSKLWIAEGEQVSSTMPQRPRGEENRNELSTSLHEGKLPKDYLDINGGFVGTVYVANSHPSRVIRYTINVSEGFGKHVMVLKGVVEPGLSRKLGQASGSLSYSIASASFE